MLPEVLSIAIMADFLATPEKRKITSEHIRFYFLVFFLFYTLISCRFRAVD